MFDQPSLLRGKGRTAFARNRVKGIVMRVLPWSHQIQVKYTDDFRVERTQLISSSRAASIRSAAGLPASDPKRSKNSKRPLPAFHLLPCVFLCVVADQTGKWYTSGSSSAFCLPFYCLLRERNSLSMYLT